MAGAPTRASPLTSVGPKPCLLVYAPSNGAAMHWPPRAPPCRACTRLPPAPLAVAPPNGRPHASQET